MRSLLSYVACAFALFTFLQPAVAQNAVPSADEAALRQSAEKFVELFNAHNAEGISQLYAEAARHEEASGEVMEGRAEIREAYTAAFEETPKAAVSLTIDSLKLLAPTVAVEQGSSEYFPDGKTLTSRSKYIVVHLKEGSTWKMASVRSLDEELVSNYQHLRQLEWLVGAWIDEAPDAVIETHCTWDAKKNYLLLDYSIRRQGESAISGTQRIGWDAQAKQIRGWLFDEDGGFGESRWTADEEGWLVKVTGVSHDGKNASATRRFTLRKADQIELVTTDRVIDGQRVPDVAVLMVRKAPRPNMEVQNILK